jgi:hypothetical protein
MLNHFTATVVDGMLRPDEPIGLPNESRVSVAIKPESAALDSLAALQSIQARLKLRPVSTDGRRFTRDQLHQRYPHRG